VADSSSKNKDNVYGRDADKRGQDPTIVGGRPMARSQLLEGIPRGIEVLIKKASVDPDFRSVLLKQRADAAVEIELELSGTEVAMLNGIPAAQMEKIIDNAEVPDEHRRVFLGKVAGAMLALLGISVPVCAWEFEFNEGYTISYHQRPGLLGAPMLEPLGFGGQSDWLRCSVVAVTANWVSGNVDYHCPFVHAEMQIVFRSRENSDQADVPCTLSRSVVSYGKGELTFYAHGKGSETCQLIIRLQDLSHRRFRLWPPPDYLPGEYHDDGIIWKILKHTKTWSAE
jgi:hypothetical protein